MPLSFELGRFVVLFIFLWIVIELIIGYGLFPPTPAFLPSTETENYCQWIPDNQPNQLTESCTLVTQSGVVVNPNYNYQADQSYRGSIVQNSALISAILSFFASLTITMVYRIVIRYEIHYEV